MNLFTQNSPYYHLKYLLFLLKHPVYIKYKIFTIPPETPCIYHIQNVVVPYVENTLYSTNKYSCVRPVHTLYINYFIEHTGGDEPHDYWTHVYMNLFTRNSPYYHLLKYLLFLLKHPVYIYNMCNPYPANVENRVSP